ncbi:hypothetical protein FPQ18DRAFT_389201 [Pyronema domesticum]|nr:hypothetical protein FPQ18DRAFT_389201 [Pyronema domesticum]
MSSSQPKPNSSSAPSNDQITYNGNSPPANFSNTNASNHSQPILPAQMSSTTHDNNHIAIPNPTLALTADNIHELQSTLDYGLQGWLLQKKEDDGVRVYGI